MKLSDVKQYLNQKVKYNNTEYTLTECILWLGKDGYRYSATLLDQNQNSTIRVDIEKVEKMEDT